MKRANIIRFVLFTIFIATIVLGIGSNPIWGAETIPEVSNQTTGASDIFLPVVMQNYVSPIIPETTELLTEDTTQYLESVSGNGATFTFSQSTPELAALDSGDVMVGGVSSAVPHGFLRQVASVDTGGGQVVVQTNGATLEDAIEQGSVYHSRTLTTEDIASSSLAEGVSLTQSLPTAVQGEEFVYNLLDVVLYDLDGDLGTTDDQVTANGSITLETSYDFGLTVKNWELDYLYFARNNTETAELIIEADLEKSVSEVKQIASHTFAPITVQVGWLPVVFVPILEVNVGVDGSVHVNMTSSVTQQATLHVGLEYENNSWNPISELTNSFTYLPPTLSTTMDARGYTKAQFRLMLYGVVGPYAEIEPYLQLQADINAVPWWTLYGGLDVPVGVKVDVLSKTIADYEVAVIDERWLLAQASTGTTRVSVASDGTQGNGNSGASGAGISVSANGRFVVFPSTANNLVSGDNNYAIDSFLHDRTTGQTTRISVASDGTEGNSSSGSPSISEDGRYIAFYSFANNLVPGDTNNVCDGNGDGVYNENCGDVFVRDTQTNQTSRISVASNRIQSNGESGTRGISVSADGRYIAFSSTASNLVSGDTNNFCTAKDGTTGANCDDIFVHDTQAGQTVRVSVNSNGIEGTNSSYMPSISADGRYIAFASNANNLVLNDTNNRWDIFVHDRQTGQTIRVSLASDGTQANNNSGGYLYDLDISSDGRYVAFASYASNLVSGDTNGAMDIFVHDRQTGQTTRISIASDGTQGNGASGLYGVSISDNGRYVTFYSEASNLISEDTNNYCDQYGNPGGTFNCPDIFIHDRNTGQTSLVSMKSNGVQGNGYGSWYPSISADGSTVSFASASSDLVPNDTNGEWDIFVHD